MSKLDKRIVADAVEARAPIKIAYDKSMKETKELKKQLDEANDKIIGALQESGTQLTAIDVNEKRVTVSTSVQNLYSCKAEDWDMLYKYIVDNDACHLLQRRLSQPAIAELKEAGVDLPVAAFKKTTLNVRTKGI